MDFKNRRSSLRKSTADFGTTDIKAQIKRRISFSGKNSVRIFHGEEEPKTWNNSYEISDHLNANETASTLCALPTKTKLPISVKYGHENKENADQIHFAKNKSQLSVRNQDGKYRHLSSENDIPNLSSLKDSMNTSCETQSSKMYQIENSVDITLCEKEKHFQFERNKNGNQDIMDSYSYSLEDYEKESRCTMVAERTIDFMRELRNDPSTTTESNTIEQNSEDEKCTPRDKYTNESQNQKFTSNKMRKIMQSINAGMNDISTYDSDQNIRSHRNVTLNNTCQMDMEDETTPLSLTKTVNVEMETLAFVDKLDHLTFLEDSDNNKQACNSKDFKSQSIYFNEYIDTSLKINDFEEKKVKLRPTIYFDHQIDILSESLNNNSEKYGATHDYKSRPTISFNQTIELSPNNMNKTKIAEINTYTETEGKCKQLGAIPKAILLPLNQSSQTVEMCLPNHKTQRKTINLCEDMEISPVSERICKQSELLDKQQLQKKENKTLEVSMLQQSTNNTRSCNDFEYGDKKSNNRPKSIINSNEVIDIAPNKRNPVKEVKGKSLTFSQTTYFDEQIEVSTRISEENIHLQDFITRPTINFNNTIVCSPNKTNRKLEEKDTNKSLDINAELNRHTAISEFNPEPTIWTNETFETCPPNFTNEISNYKENMEVSPTKVPHESIASSLVKPTEQPKLIFRKICTPVITKTKNKVNLEKQMHMQEIKNQEQNALDDNAISMERPVNAENSLNFTLNSLKNMSLSPDSSSPLIPLEFKGYSLKQLNDELECGKIKIFSSAPKNSPCKRTGQISISNFYPGNNIESTQSTTKARNTIVFQDLDITSDGNLSKNPESKKSKKMFDFCISQDGRGRKNGASCRYSQADDIMLDNTSFLTKAKLSDETASRNSSKRDSTQANESIFLFDADNNNEKHIGGSTSKMIKSWQPVTDTELCSWPHATANSYNVAENNIDKRFPDNCKDQLRQTLYFNSDVIAENESNETRGCINIKDCHQGFDIDKTFENRIVISPNNSGRNEKSTPIKTEYHSSQARKTLYFNEEIPIEKETTPIVKKNMTSNDDENCTHNPKRYTRFFNSDIPSNEILLEVAQNLDNNFNTSDIYFSNPKIKTCYDETDFSEEKGSVVIDQRPLKIFSTRADENAVPKFNNISKLNTIDKASFNIDMSLEDTSIKITEDIEPERHLSVDNAGRKTLYFNKEISLENESFSREQNSVPAVKYFSDARKTLYFNDEISELEDQKVLQSSKDVNVNENTKEMVTECSSEDQKKRNVIDSNFSKNGNNAEIQKINCLDVNLNREERLGIYPLDLTLDDVRPLNNTVCVSEDKIKIGIDKKESLIWEESNDMSLDESPKSSESIRLAESAKTRSGIKMALEPPACINSPANKSKLNNIQQSIFITPKKFTDTNIRNNLPNVTPSRSLSEFVALETHFRNSKHKSPYWNKNCKKRLTVNITPVLSQPKKRHTSAFEDCQVEGSLEDNNISKEKSNNIKQTDEETNRKWKCAANEDAIQISKSVANESALQTSPKDRISRIPIPISSGKKQNKSIFFSNESKNNDKEVFEVNMDDENFTESIQLVRRATTFVQNKEASIEQHELDPEIVSHGKRSIFESNPITISDVSVFFDAQRKSAQTEGNLAFEESNNNIFCPVENSTKCLENRFINFTLEDIDKTHLSLVELSYDDCTANTSGHKQECNISNKQPQSNTTYNKENVVNEDQKRTRRSVNYLRDISLVCRKCKRCQQTLSDESYSSALESFRLPAPPPLPDLGLDRLRRLRKRPTIADVHALWQSTDYTVVNAMDISCNTDDETEDQESVATKLIREYEQDMMSFEMDLEQRKQQYRKNAEKLPFVSRLNALLRSSSTNWIFDYQMQYRGILLFTHKKMLTFSLYLTFEEVDQFGHDIILNSVKLEKSRVPKENWKPIDFVLDFQLRLNLPFNIKELCKSSSEDDIFAMLQEIDSSCLETVKMGNRLQLICVTNQASITRDQCRTCVTKTIRKIVDKPNTDFKCVDTFEIKVELLNLNQLSFKNIFLPRLHNFREEIHLLPTGLQFLQEFLPNCLKYLKSD